MNFPGNGAPSPGEPPASVSGNPAVTVNDLVKKFGNFTAVHGISFSVKRGEIFGFLGPNGAGKSTTIRMLCGIITPTSGTGTVGGHDIRNDSELIKEKIGYMSQKFSLYEDLTVEENIEFYADIYDVPPHRFGERKKWILEMANLTDRAGSLTRELSMGWKQRLALGCAIVHEPQILFLDEPTAGVDPVSRRNFWDLIYKLAGQGVTVFVTTHYMDEAEHCDRLAMIYRGRLIAMGSPGQLKSRFISGTLLEIRGPDVIRHLDSLRGLQGVCEAAIFGASIHVSIDDQGRIESVRKALSASGITSPSIETVSPALEDVFVAMVENADREAEEEVD